MSFLTGLIALIVEWFLSQLESWGIGVVKEKQQESSDFDSNQKQADSDANLVKGADSDDKRRDAASTIARDTF